MNLPCPVAITIICNFIVGRGILKSELATKIAACFIIIIFILLHSTPSIALRSHLFITCHPVVAFTTGIVDDELHNKTDKQELKGQNAKCYTLTKPVHEEATDSYLENYIVKKVGFLLFAKYYGEA